MVISLGIAKVRRNRCTKAEKIPAGGYPEFCPFSYFNPVILIVMYRLILLFVFAAAFTTASAQFYRKADFYPRVSPVPQKVFEHFDKRIYAGCVEGNCKDGSGTWLELIAEGYGKSVTDPMY